MRHFVLWIGAPDATVPWSLHFRSAFTGIARSSELRFGKITAVLEEVRLFKFAPHWLGSTASRRKSGLPRLPTTGDQPTRCFFRCVMIGGG